MEYYSALRQDVQMPELAARLLEESRCASRFSKSTNATTSNLQLSICHTVCPSIRLSVTLVFVCVFVCVTSLLSRFEFGVRTHIRQICRLVSLPLAFSLFVVSRLLPIHDIDIVYTYICMSNRFYWHFVY